MKHRTCLILSLVIYLSLLSFNKIHKFYVSTTDVEYIEADQELQVISKLFIDDMEHLLKTRYSDNLKLGKNSESKDADTFIERYFTDKFTVSVNGQRLLLQYLGHTYDDDLIKCFFKAEGVSELSSIEVTNQVLLDIFEEQQNVVHVNNGEKIKSLLLMKDRESEVLNFR